MTLKKYILFFFGNTFTEGEMNMDFKNSQRKDNLMRAFAGESQARNRYQFAANQAKSVHQYVLAELFEFTAKQEEAHAKVFYDHLMELSGETISIDGTYPVDISDDLVCLLNAANHNETEEAEDVYPEFARIAQEEGYKKIALDFENIAKIEETHANRFEKYALLMENQELYKCDDANQQRMCLHCGHIHTGVMAPKMCPVCGYEQGHFIRLETVEG